MTTTSSLAPLDNNYPITIMPHPFVANTLYNDMGGERGFGDLSVSRNDDGYSDVIDLTPVFGEQGINLYGDYYTEAFVNTNGNITFERGLSTYTPREIGSGISSPIIAPFWADVDTNNSTDLATTPGGHSTGSNLAWFDLDEDTGTFTVTWDDVGFYPSNNSLQNAFQLRMTDTGEGNFDLEFIYEDINWTTGNASGGSGGLGGTVARAGFSAGDGVNYFELAASGRQSDILNLDNLEPFTWSFEDGQLEEQVGTEGDDNITGTGEGEDIYAGAGDDVLDMSAGGDNTAVLGGGNDEYYGGDGDDTVYPVDGDNHIEGGDGHDTVIYDDPVTQFQLQERLDEDGNVYQVVVNTGRGNTDSLYDIEDIVFGVPVFLNIQPETVQPQPGQPALLNINLTEAVSEDVTLELVTQLSEDSIGYVEGGNNERVMTLPIPAGESYAAVEFNYGTQYGVIPVTATITSSHEQDVVFADYSREWTTEFDYIGEPPQEPEYELTASMEAVDEGQEAQFTLYTNVEAGTEVAYTLAGVNAADIDGDLTGTTVISENGTADIRVALTADSATEGDETLMVSIDGTDETASVQINDTSTGSTNHNAMPKAIAQGVMWMLAATEGEGTVLNENLTDVFSNILSRQISEENGVYSMTGSFSTLVKIFTFVASPADSRPATPFSYSDALVESSFNMLAPNAVTVTVTNGGMLSAADNNYIFNITEGTLNNDSGLIEATISDFSSGDVLDVAEDEHINISNVSDNGFVLDVLSTGQSGLAIYKINFEGVDIISDYSGQDLEDMQVQSSIQNELENAWGDWIV